MSCYRSLRKWKLSFSFSLPFSLKWKNLSKGKKRKSAGRSKLMLERSTWHMSPLQRSHQVHKEALSFSFSLSLSPPLLWVSSILCHTLYIYLYVSPLLTLFLSPFLSLSFSLIFVFSVFFFLYICHLYVYFLLCIFLARLLTLSIFLSLSFSLFLSLSLCNFLKERTWFWKHVKCIKTRPLYLFLCLNQPFSLSLAGYNRTTNYVLNWLRVDLFSLNVKVDCLDCLLGYCVSLLMKNLMILSNTDS